MKVIFWAVGTLLLLTCFIRAQNDFENPAVEKKRQELSVAELNKRYILIGLLGQPVGTRCRIVGKFVEIPEKPGKYFAVDLVQGERLTTLVPEQLLRCVLPAANESTNEISFVGSIELENDKLLSEIENSQICQSYIHVTEAE